MTDPDHSSSRQKSAGNAAEPASALDWARRNDMTTDVLAHLRILTRRRQRRRVLGFSFAFATALVAVVTMLQYRPVATKPADPQIGEVAVLPPRQQVLADGSYVELNDLAEIKVDYSAAVRRVELLRGAAHFTVAKNPERPFVVVVNGVSVQAVGTAFCVDRTSADIVVLVTEGQVAVTDRGHADGDAAPSQPRQVLVGKGNKTMVGYGGDARNQALTVLPIDATDRDLKLGWRMPRLDFFRTPLAEVLSKFNHYNEQRFVLDDPTLAELRISGSLRADKTEALKELLRLGLDLRVEDNGAGEILIRR